MYGLRWWWASAHREKLWSVSGKRMSIASWIPPAFCVCLAFSWFFFIYFACWKRNCPNWQICLAYNEVSRLIDVLVLECWLLWCACLCLGAICPFRFIVVCSICMCDSALLWLFPPCIEWSSWWFAGDVLLFWWLSACLNVELLGCWAVLPFSPASLAWRWQFLHLSSRSGTEC